MPRVRSLRDPGTTDIDWQGVGNVLLAMADESPDEARALGEGVIARVERQRFVRAATKRFAEITGGVMES